MRILLVGLDLLLGGRAIKRTPTTFLASTLSIIETTIELNLNVLMVLDGELSLLT